MSLFNRYAQAHKPLSALTLSVPRSLSLFQSFALFFHCCTNEDDDTQIPSKMMNISKSKFVWMKTFQITNKLQLNRF